MSFPALYAVNEYLLDFSLAPCDFLPFSDWLLVIALVWITTHRLSLIHGVCSLSSRNYFFLSHVTKVKTYDRVWPITTGLKNYSSYAFFSRFLDQFR